MRFILVFTWYNILVDQTNQKVRMMSTYLQKVTIDNIC